MFEFRVLENILAILAARHKCDNLTLSRLVDQDPEALSIYLWVNHHPNIDFDGADKDGNILWEYADPPRGLGG